MTMFRRLVFIDKELNSKKFVNAKTLSRDYNVSEKTIYRDIELLRDEFSAPVKYNSREKSYYYTNKFSLNIFSFSEIELHTLAVLREMLKSIKLNPYKSPQKSLFAKLKLNFGDQIQKQIEFVKDKISFRFNKSGSIDENVFSKIEKALFEEREVEIEYQKPGSEISEKRIFDPYHLRNYEGNWYLIGFDHGKKKIRVLNAKRIFKLHVRKSGFDIPDDFSIESYFEFSFANRRTSEIHKVVLEIRKDKADEILERIVHLTHKLTKLKNGNIKIEFQTNELTELSNWVMSNADSLKVIKPNELKHILKSTAAKIINTYQK